MLLFLSLLVLLVLAVTACATEKIVVVVTVTSQAGERTTVPARGNANESPAAANISQATSVGQSSGAGSSISSEGADSPESAVRKLLDGMTKNDQNEILDSMDPAARSDPFGPANFGAIAQILVAGLTGADIGRTQISFLDVALSTAPSGDPSFATVYLTARVRAFGQENQVNGVPIPTVKKSGRWFVTNEQGSATGVQTAQASATENALRSPNHILEALKVGKEQVTVDAASENAAVTIAVSNSDAVAHSMVLDVFVRFPDGGFRDVGFNNVLIQPSATTTLKNTIGCVTTLGQSIPHCLGAVDSTSVCVSVVDGNRWADLPCWPIARSGT